MPTIRAPELTQTAPWLNTDRPLSLKALRGRVVLLDFWTYGCINCVHILPDLAYLEHRYGDRLVIIGVHAAKFAHEQELDSIQQAVWRYGIPHPVLVDSGFDLWQRYAVRAWPTLVVIDPAGYVVATLSGEGHRDRLDAVIGSLLRAQEENSGTTPAPPLWTTEPSPVLSPLAFPGQVLVDEARDRCFIADSGHHRLVITTLNGTLQHIVGTGTPGWVDGGFAEAQLTHPQGLSVDPTRPLLYVADTGTHTLRQVDWQQQTVTTLAGTGQQSRILRSPGGAARDTALNSPWGLQVVGDRLFIAMAGAHQIWVLDLTSQQISPYLGTGAEFRVDGGRDEAAFAQPSGLTTDGQVLFVADSESSTLRAVSLSEPATVRTVCGSGDLFGFGDVDGVGEAVRLQHCLGVACDAAGWLWLADTYNHKIKRVHPSTGQCETIAGDRQAGWVDGVGRVARFAEPSGLSASRTHLYIADTNNHAIRRLHWQTLEVTSLAIAGLCAPTVCVPAGQSFPSAHA